MSAPARLRGLWSDRQGMAVVELAIVLPVFLVLVMGILDIAQMLYARGLLVAAVEQAARTSTIQGTDTTAADAIVKSIVAPVLPGATFSGVRTSYSDFTDIGRPEKFTDNNGNGTCDASEPYVDENGNGQWDADIGVSGNGGASDAVVYTMTVTYTPTFRIPFMPAQWGQMALSATSVRKNQPFGQQATYGTATGTC